MILHILIQIGLIVRVLLRPLKGRIDLRNHRKIVVIDYQITYCGSQNCADQEFLVKAKFAPWVDAMMRFKGPIARQNQFLFASDWEAETGENISDLQRQPIPPAEPGLPAQVVGTGPTIRYSAMPEIFESLTADMRQRQESYIAKSKPITGEMVERWTWRRRLWNNSIAILGPVL